MTRAGRQDYPRPKHPRRTVGGKFNSIGSAQDQAANLDLIRRNLAEIRRRGTTTLLAADLIFIEDVEMKLGQKGNPMFGWRQIENIVRIHSEVCAVTHRK